MAVLSVGHGKLFSTIPAAIAAAKDGDTIEVQTGTYTNQYAHIDKDITLTGVGGTVKMVSTGLIPNGKGIFIADGNVTINNFEFDGAKVVDQNGAGIRQQTGNLTLNNDAFFHNQMGVLTGNSGKGSVTVTNSEFGFNGSGSRKGIGHNLYVGRMENLTVDNSYFHDAHVGHEIKSRADNNTIINSRIFDLNGDASYSIDLPEGGNATIKNNVIEQGPKSPNSTIITYGEEGHLNPGKNFVVSGNTIINDKRGHGTGVLNTTSAVAEITNNKFYGLTSGQIASGHNTQSGNQFLTAAPKLDTSHPTSAGSPPPITNPPPGGSPPPAHHTGDLTIKVASDTGQSASDHITLNPIITGTGNADSLVIIKEGGVTLGSVMADDAGAWTFTPKIADGKHTLVVSQGDDTASISMTLDRMAPKESIHLFLDTGAKDGITSNPAVTGTGEPNTVVTIKQGNTVLGTTTASNTGSWSFTPTDLADGAHTLLATQTDLAGNVGTARLTFTIDSNLDAAALTGTEGNDVLTGTLHGLNTIYGLGGNDVISVQYGNATTEIYGGDGNDVIKGSLWNNDYIDGGPGNDTIFGNWGNGTILGGDGDDRIYGSSGSDTIYGGSGNDFIQGGYGNDTIYDEQGVNRISGGGGNDTAVFTGNYADYSLILADGAVTVTGSQGTSTLTNIETIRFQDYSYDVLAGLFLK